MKDLYEQWKNDERAPFEGWDFSYLKDSLVEEQPPWDYKEVVKGLVKNATAVLDMGTGGGEILASLAPLPMHTVATEGYEPNVQVAKKRLESLGVKVVAVDESGKLPFADEEFDLVLNRHSAFDGREVYRTLKSGGIFLTQQVGGNNLDDLIREFGGKSKFKSWSVGAARQELESVGFEIGRAEGWSGKVEFKDVGAIVYFLKAIPWAIEGFSVDKHLPTLERLQKELDENRKLVFTQTRFIIQAQKSSWQIVTGSGRSLYNIIDNGDKNYFLAHSQILENIGIDYVDGDTL